MELTQLQYFRVVAQMEHVTRAAQELHITQPSLSKTIARLEAELGVSLFDRYSNAIRLNEYGKIFLRQVDRIFENLEDARQEIEDMRGGNMGTLSFAIDLPSLAKCALKQFVLNTPGVHVRQIECSAENMRELLRSREVDLAVSSEPVHDLDLQWEELGERRMGIIVSENHPFAAQGTVSLAELEKEHFLINNANDTLNARFSNYCEQVGFRPRILFEGNQSEVIFDLIRQGRGISVVAKAHYDAEIAPNERQRMQSIVHVELINPICVHPVGIVTLRNRYLPAAAYRFCDFLREALLAGELKSGL